MMAIIIAVGIWTIGAFLLMRFDGFVRKLIQAGYHGLQTVFYPVVYVMHALRVRADHLTWIRIAGSAAVITWSLTRGDPATKTMVQIGICLAITDLFDGLLATLGKKSSYGALLDALGDKAFVVAFSLRFLEWQMVGWILWLTYVMYAGSIAWIIGFWVRYQVPLRFLNMRFRANDFGKAKTTLQMIALALLYWAEVSEIRDPIIWNSLIALGFGTILELKSKRKSLRAGIVQQAAAA